MGEPTINWRFSERCIATIIRSEEKLLQCDLVSRGMIRVIPRKTGG